MKNPTIDHDEARIFELSFAKSCADLANPEPPIRLEQVRELLKLDRDFYTSTDTGLLREFVSRMFVAGKQVIMRPTLLFDVIGKPKSQLYGCLTNEGF